MVKIDFKANDNAIKSINNKIEKITNSNSLNYYNYEVYKLICSCNTFYIGNTS